MGVFSVKAKLSHIQINVSDAAKSLPFYKDLLTYFGYTVMMEDPKFIGMDDGNGMTIWVNDIEEKFKDNKFHRKSAGLNHLAFHVESKEDVDKFTKEFLQPRGLNILYESPKLFPEYTPDYYAVYFEDPDRIKLEVVSQ